MPDAEMESIEQMGEPNTAPCDNPKAAQPEHFVPWHISIRPLIRGYILQIGCHQYEFAFESKERLMEALDVYLKNPRRARKQFDRGDLEHLWRQ